MKLKVRSASIQLHRGRTLTKYSSKTMAMNNIPPKKKIVSIKELADFTDYSFLNSLVRDPDATKNGDDFKPRQVLSGHYVPVKPTPLPAPQYVTHSKLLFEELSLSDSLAVDEDFVRLFSGDLSKVPEPIKPMGWATGYALSIFGTEYVQQCPFQTGNGYGDGRAISVLEAVINNKRWEMQLKGAGRTPYCRGGDGRAVLRSSVREFLAQEHMHALNIPTSRSLSLYVSNSEQVDRPWYLDGSQSVDPEIMVANPVAISTRVAPSFIRVGQIELFGRRARSNEHKNAKQELKMLVLHAIEREYKDEIEPKLPLEDQLLLLASKYRNRLISLVCNWLRVGYCQGNFNSDNCAIGGITLDYGPFGFCETFDPSYQAWTGGGRHFSFFNQPLAAQKNFDMFCSALEHLFDSNSSASEKLIEIRSGFAKMMERELEMMWATKLGLEDFDRTLFIGLMQLMVKTKVDYTIFFRELSNIPDNISQLENSFYKTPTEALYKEWEQWLSDWRALICKNEDLATLSKKMKRINPKYTWREWLVAPAYQNAMKGDYALIKELQKILTTPYDELSSDVEEKYYQKCPEEFLWSGGISHYSCSS